MYIVVYDDEMGLCAPYMEDPDCPGALTGFTKSWKVALFADRTEARKAIKISAAYALLRRLQGLRANDDFLPESRQNIHIVPCAAYGASRKAVPHEEKSR